MQNNFKGGVFVDALEIKGDRRLSGELIVQGSKNSALPILAAAFLPEGESIIHNCPDLKDVKTGIKILENLGCKCIYNSQEKTVKVDTQGAVRSEIPECLMCEMRSSVMFLGAILSKMRKAKISYPGGCELGPRPINIHLKAFEELGVEIEEYNGYIYCAVDKVRPATINLQIPSVGATENIMLLCAVSDGETVIQNAACEPEIEDLQNFLCSMGAKIEGAGSSQIVIKGVKRLTPSEYTVIPDRIAATTFICATACCGGDILLKDACINHISQQLSMLKDSGLGLEFEGENIRVKAKNRISALKLVKTSPYPGFPTDAQALFMASMATADGTTIFVENIFESRYKHISELTKMGADITAEGRVAVVRGCDFLQGARVSAADLRGGAALVIAGLSAFDKTLISGVEHIDRGYECIEKSFEALGADIKRKRIIF